MSNPNGWPDADHPGVPLNPERDGVHQLNLDGDVLQAHWWSDAYHWTWLTMQWTPKVCARANYRYLGPCLTPAEVEAKVKAARNAALEEAAAWHDGEARWRRDGLHERADFHNDCAAAIRALKETPNE